MTGALFVQLVINGLAIGLIYVMVASGLVLVLGIARVFNFAHGQFYMLGAYATYFLITLLKINMIPALIIALAIGAFLGGLSYRTIFHYMRGDLLRCGAASIAISMILQQLAVIVFKPTSYGVNLAIFSRIIEIGGVTLLVGRLILIFLCLGVMSGLYYLLKCTKTGKAMRAISLDSTVASLLGINTVKIYWLTLALGSGLAAIAGGAIAPLFVISTEMGSSVILIVFMVMVVGGIESLPGAVVAGILIGFLQSFGYHFLTGYAELFMFCFVAVLLIFKPRGLFGTIVKEVY